MSIDVSDNLNYNDIERARRGSISGKINVFCELCRDYVSMKNPWYEQELHMRKYHSNQVILEAVKKYMKLGEEMGNNE